MALDDSKLWIQTSQTLPSATVDGVNGPVRGGKRGELFVESFGRKSAADEGSYFVITNPTPGTGLAGHAAPTDITVDTKPFFFMRNTSTATEDKRIYLDYIRLQSTVAGANGTNLSWCVKLDTGTTRWASGGTALTPTNTNMQSTATASATVYYGATASAASASQRIIGSGLLRTVITVVGDTYLWTFGESPMTMSSMIAAGTAIANIKVPLSPIVLGPTDQILLHLASASESAANYYEMEVGFWQR